MDRRLFLKLSALAAAATALPALPVAAEPGPEGVLVDRAPDPRLAFRPTVTDSTRLSVHEPGTYQIYGQVRLQDPWVEISGIGHTQWISWSGIDGAEQPVTSFTAFEQFDRPGMTTIQVRGGQLEAVDIVPMDAG
jgi:hypothetical protein